MQANVILILVLMFKTPDINIPTLLWITDALINDIQREYGWDFKSNFLSSAYFSDKFAFLNYVLKAWR